MKRKDRDELLDFRSKRTTQSPGQPLPVPLGSLTGNAPSNFVWKCYTGKLVVGDVENNAGRKCYVRVTKKDHMDALYTHGYFGTVALNSVPCEPEYTVDAWNPGFEFLVGSHKAENQENTWTKDEGFWKEDSKCDSNTDAGEENCERIDEVDDENKTAEQDTNESGDVKSDDCEQNSKPGGSNADEPDTTGKSEPDPDEVTCKNLEPDKASPDKPDPDGRDDSGPQNWDQVAKFNRKVCASDVCLELELCEAFFLSYAIGCLVVTDAQDKEMNLIQMWSLYLKLETDFPFRYAAYHHCRSRGWITRSGYRMGSDWLLYKLGPPFYHATFIVRVEVVCGSSGSLEAPALTFAQLLGINRMTENVNKSLLIARVEKHSVQPQDWNTPHMLNKLAVSLKRIKRWQPGDMRWDHKPEVPRQSSQSEGTRNR